MTTGGPTHAPGDLAQVSPAWLTAELPELTARLRDALGGAIFSNRQELHPTQFSHVAAAEAQMLAAYLARPDDAAALDRGAQLRRAGLGDIGLTMLGQAARRFVLSAAPEPLRMRALDSVERYESGVIRGYIAAHTAITLEEQEHLSFSELTQTTQELRKARDAADEAKRALRSFLTNMSHELRTPLTGIIGYSELLQHEARRRGCSDMVADLGKINAAGQQLLAIINDILDLATIESGTMQVAPGHFNLGELLLDVQAAVAPLIQRNRNTFLTQISRQPGTMYSDSARIRQVLLSLLGNAAKFTSDGTIILRTDYARRDGQEWVAISIADTGIGIVPEQLGRLFQAFTQADASMTRRYGGAGLGLALCQRLSLLLGGTIDVTSQPGVGSTFTVHLPLVLSSAHPHERDGRQRRHRALLVEDGESAVKRGDSPNSA